MGKEWVWIRKRCSLIKLWVAVQAVILSISGCALDGALKEPLPEETLEAFEEAMNAMDVNGMMDCMDEKTKRSITAGMDLAMDLIGAITDVDLGFSAEDFIDAMPLFQEFIPAGQSEYPTVDFQAEETYISGNKATVYFYEVNSGEISVVNMVKEDGMWKMSLSTRLIDKSDADRVIIAGEEVPQEPDDKNSDDKNSDDKNSDDKNSDDKNSGARESDDKEDVDLEEFKDAVAEFFGF